MEKGNLKEEDFKEILLNYNLGELKSFQIIKNGTVQTNYLVVTDEGKFVLRLYSFRKIESIKFEINLINYILKRKFPTAFPMKGKNNKYINFYKDNPYVFFEFIKGEHISNPSQKQFESIIKAAGLLNNMTKNYNPKYREYRWNYNPEFCRNLAKEKAGEIGSENAKEKYRWITGELEKLNLPSNLTRGVCHCDFHYSNIFFDDDRFVALIDFDDANYTYLTYDLVSLMNPFLPEFSWKTWKKFGHEENILVFDECRYIIQEYLKYRPMSSLEKRHIFDVYKLSVLIDCLWYFRRGKVEDFFEKRKIDALNNLGREKFFGNLFE